MSISAKQHAVICGTLLGDGTLERNGRYCRLRLRHGLEQESYIQWKRDLLGNLISGEIKKACSYHKKTQKTYCGMGVSTFSLPELEIYFQNFYQRGRKGISRQVFEWLADPLAVAVWFMDDGYKRNDCNALRLNTDSFTREDQDILQKALRKHYDIPSRVHKKGKWWNIYIPSRAAKRFVQTVQPYIIPKMRYKITLAP